MKYIIESVMVIVLCLSMGFRQAKAQLVWTANIDSTTTWSSVRGVDLNADQILDFVIGGGYELVPTNYGIIALDGSSGDTLWTSFARDQMFTSPVFFDVNGDEQIDVIIGGRSAELRALDGSNGELIWEFYPFADIAPPSDSGYYNFYTPQILDDVNGDQVNDLLCANGGDLAAQPGDPDRPPGNLMIVSGATGDLIAKSETPDGRETYCSPLVATFGTADVQVVFGTGGETVEGGLWRCTLQDILSGDLSGAELLHSSTSNGYVAPPSLADFNGDNILDIVANSYDDDLVVIDGVTGDEIWTLSIPNSESNVNPTIGNFNEDAVPDIHTIFGNGVWPNYNLFRKMTLNGQDGSFIDSVNTTMMKFSCAMAVDFTGDGVDELVEVNTNRHYNSQLQTWVFTVEVLVSDLWNEVELFSYGPHYGSSVVSTPWVGDVDDDGLLDIVYAYMADSLNPMVTEGLKIRRLETQFEVPEQLSWSSYLGTRFDGIYMPFNGQPVSTETVQAEGFWVGPQEVYGLDGRLIVNLDPYESPHQKLKSIGCKAGVYIVRKLGLNETITERLFIH